MSQTVARPSNTRLAAEQLRGMILSGQLAPGTDHLETELAEQLGMSRTPVREAALMLEGQGLLEVRPRKGVRILPISPEDMAQIYDILTALESQAAARAAEAGHSEADLAELADAIAAMDAALAAGEREGWAAADARFHAELMRLGGNSRAAGIVAMLSDQVQRARNATLWVRPVPSKSNDDHRRVMDAILMGDPETAHDVHRRHRIEAGRLLVELLKKHHLFRL